MANENVQPHYFNQISIVLFHSESIQIESYLNNYRCIQVFASVEKKKRKNYNSVQQLSIHNLAHNSVKVLCESYE